MTSDDRGPVADEAPPAAPANPPAPPDEGHQGGAEPDTGSAETGSVATTAPPSQRSPLPWMVIGGVLLLLVIGGIVLAVLDNRPVTAYDLGVGDCLQDPLGPEEDGGEVLEIDAVPCAQPHNAEVYAVFDHPAGEDEDYPGEQSVVDYSNDGCLDRFEDYVGIAYPDSRYFFATLYPSELSWAEGDREFACMATTPPGEQMTGSVKDSGD